MSGKKRTIDGSEKRKHVALSIVQKVEILKKLEGGTSVNFAASSYGVSPRTVYDIKKNREKILTFFANTDNKSVISKRKSMHSAKSSDLDMILYEWFRQRREEGIPITGPLLCAKAKEFHSELKIEEACNFTSGWLTRFKERHGIRYLKACGEKLSADNLAADDFIDEFSCFIKTEGLSPEQIYNMDETGLFWRCLPRKTLAAASETSPSGIKESKERLTVIVCSNAAGTHRCKLAVIGKSAHPRAFKGLKLPVTYSSNAKAWVTRAAIQKWFEDQFVPEAREHCLKAGLPDGCKIVLLMDNCAAHPHSLEKDNVSTMFLPPNTTSLIQPMDQGIINSMKCHYRTLFLKKFLTHNHNQSTNIWENYKKIFTIKDCIFKLDEAWNTVSKETLSNAWHNLWPELIFVLDDTSSSNDFEGFRISHEKVRTEELLAYARNSAVGLDHDEIQSWMTGVDEPPITQHITDEEIISGIIKRQSDTDSDTESEEEGERITCEEGLSLGDKYLNFLLTQPFVTEQELLTVRMLQEKLLKHKMKSLKQSQLDMFLNLK